MEILGLVDIPLWFILLLSVSLLLYIYGSWNHSLWTSQGLAGPRPWPLTGNLVEIMRKTAFAVYSDWQETYGRTVGFYNGVRPCIMTTDLDMLREVMVKSFNTFTHRNFISGLRPQKVDKGLFFAGGTTWKRIRTLMTPTFSTSKLKLMSHYVNRCSDLLVKCIGNKVRADQLIDVKDLFGQFTMDVITGTAFGLETNSLTQEEEPFVQHCKKVFANAGFTGAKRYLFLFVNAFPFVAPLLGGFGFGTNAEFFFNALEKLVDERREETNTKGKKASDLLQMLVEVEADPEQISEFSDNSDETKSCRRMTKEEVMAQGFIVLIAGFETTATTLQYMIYNLTVNPQAQDKVYEELQRELGDEVPTYDNVSKLKYMDAVIHETLRMFPPVPVISREASDAITLKGIHIPAGCGILIPIYTIMHDPEYFPEPEVFKPERFLEENASKISPVTEELPFGYGPRKCIGSRLAILEIKFAAAQICRKFRFVKCAETPDKITLGKSPGLSVPDTVIKVKAEERTA